MSARHLFVVALALIVGACSSSGRTPMRFAGQALSATNEWPFYRYDYPGDSFVKVPLTSTQAQGFSPAWTFAETGSVDDTNGVVVGGVLYQVYYNNRLRAVDVATGTLKWTAAMNAPTGTPCDPNFKGGAEGAAAVDNGTVFVPGGDGQVYAFRASDGTKLWSTPVADNSANEFLWSSAFPLNGSLYQGVATFGGEETCGSAPGRLVQLSESTGQTTGTWWSDAQHRGGGTIWTQPAYDAATGRLFVVTGNPGLNIAATDEPYSQAVVAIDPNTMQAVDSYQVLTTDAATDYDFGASPALVDTASGQHLIVAMNKNGYAYALDRNHLANGLVWSHPVCLAGSSPETGNGSIVSPAAANGHVFVGGGATADGFSGIVEALDPATGAAQWTFHPDGFILAALTAVGDVLVAPATNGSQGHVYVLNQSDGSVLFHYDGNDFASQPTFAEGKLFAADTIGNIHAFTPGAGATNSIDSASLPVYSSAALSQPESFNGFAEPDATQVTVTLNGALTASSSLPTSANEQSWTVTFSASSFASLPDGPVTASATVTTPGGTIDAGSLTITKNVNPPGPVTSFVATGGAGQVSLSWVDPTASDYASTRVLASPTGFASSPTATGDQVVVFDAAGTSATATGLASSTTYFFTAFARDSAGNWSSATTAQATTSATTSVSFSDPFTECTSTTDLGPDWTIVNGLWYCASGKARGESASSTALAKTGSMSDIDETVRVQLAVTSSASGLAARESNGSYYAERVVPATQKVEIIRVNSGTATVLGSVAQAVQLEPSSYRIRLQVTGLNPVHLVAWFAGTQVLTVDDGTSQQLSSGQAGLYNGADARTQFDGYSLTGSTATSGTNAITTASIPVYSAADSGMDETFSGTAEPDATQVTVTLDGSLSASATLPTSANEQSWSVTFSASTFASLPDGPVTAAATVTTANGTASAGSLIVTKNVNPPGPVTGFVATGGDGEVTLTWTNPTDADYASTRILESPTGFASSPVPSGDEVTVFDKAGTNATASGLAASTAYFFTAYARDSAGNWSIATTAHATTSAATSVSFSDSFTECTSTTDLGPDWSIVNGLWYCAAGKARGEAAASTAVAKTSPMSDLDETVRVQFATSASFGGLSAREANGSYYAERVVPATQTVEIIRVDAGAVTVLGSVPQSVQLEPSSYRIRLQVTGTNPTHLVAWFAGTQMLAIDDASAQQPTTGQAGLYNGADARTAFEGFSVTSP